MEKPDTEFIARSEATWLAVLTAARCDLNALAESLTTDELRVATLKGQWVVYADRLQECDGSVDAEQCARELLLPVLQTLTRRHSPRAHLNVDTVFRLHPDGHREVYASLTAEVTIGVRMRGTLTVGDQDAPTETYEDRFARLAMMDGRVRDAMAFRQAVDGAEWGGLYRVRELIEADVGGDAVIAARSWCTKNWLTRFDRTACSSAGGATRRHGHERFAPPPNPLSIGEARAGIDRLFYAWIDWKLDGRRMPTDSSAPGARAPHSPP